MSKVKIEGNASGTGTLTISAPNTDTDRTLTLPDGAGEILTDASTLSSSNLSGALPAIDGSALTGISSALLGMKYVRYSPASDRILPNGDPITQLNITYTPVSSDSHIELSWNGAIEQNGSNRNLNIRFYRDTTVLGTGGAIGGQNENNTYLNTVEQNLYVSEFGTGHTAGTEYTFKVYTWASDSAWSIKSDQTHRMILKEWSGDVVTYAGENT